MKKKQYGLLSWGGMGTTLELAGWRDEEWKAGNFRKAKRIQKVIDNRKIRHGGHIAHRE